MIHFIKKNISAEIKTGAKRVVKNTVQSTHYFFCKNRARPNNVKKILFICKGNVCRSPFAEFYAKEAFKDKNFIFYSCGLEVDQQVPSPEMAIQIATDYQVDLSPNRSKSVKYCNIEKVDLIIGMEFSHYQGLRNHYPHVQNKMLLLRDFLPWPASLQCNIADPYGENADEFRKCFNIMSLALDRMVVLLLENQGPR